MEARDSFCFPKNTKNPNPSPIEKRFGFSWFDTKNKRHTNACSPVDIPTGWEPRTKQQPTGLIAYPAAQGRAVQVLLSAQKKEKTYERMSFLGAVKQSKSEPFPFDAAWAASSNVTVCVPSL